MSQEPFRNTARFLDLDAGMVAMLIGSRRRAVEGRVAFALVAGHRGIAPAPGDVEVFNGV